MVIPVIGISKELLLSINMSTGAAVVVVVVVVLVVVVVVVDGTQQYHSLIAWGAVWFKLPLCPPSQNCEPTAGVDPPAKEVLAVLEALPNTVLI